VFSGTLALLTRSLRVGSRSVMPHLLHFGLIVLTFLTMLTMIGQTAISAPGLELFRMMVYLNFFFILLAGCGLFASAITEEKEEGTLDLLQMAGINPLTLLLGKLVPRLISCLLMLAVQFPLVVLAITLGGVTRFQVFAAYVSLAAFVCLVAGIALLASVLCRKTSTASILTGVIVIFLLIAPYVLSSVVTPLARKGWPTEWLVQLAQFGRESSILNRISSILASTFVSSIWCTQLVSSLAGGLMAFLLGWLVFPLCATDEKTSRSGVGNVVRRWFVAFRPGRAWPMALAWKDFHFHAGGMVGVVCRLIMYPGVLVGFYLMVTFGSRNRWNPSREDIGATLMISSLIFGALELANIAGRVFRDEVREKTLAGLMILPRSSVIQIVYPKVAGYLLSLVPTALYFGLGAIAYPEGFADAVNEIFSSGEGLLVLGAFVVQFVFFLHMSAFLTLFIKWGAVPLAFGVSYILFYFCFGLFAVSGGGGGGDGMGLVFVMMMIGIVAIISVHFAIGEKLKELGAA
jgi:hypothetical protein